MPAAYTYRLSVQVLDFRDTRLLIQLARLVCDFCSSSQRFACGFLQIPPRDGHPCRPANSSPCRVCRRFSLPSECALPGAQEKAATVWPRHTILFVPPKSRKLYPDKFPAYGLLLYCLLTTNLVPPIVAMALANLVSINRTTSGTDE